MERRTVGENRCDEKEPGYQCRWLQWDDRQEGVKLHTMQTELAVMVAVVRFIDIGVYRIEPLSGHQGEQKQIVKTALLSSHTFLFVVTALARWINRYQQAIIDFLIEENHISWTMHPETHHEPMHNMAFAT